MHACLFQKGRLGVCGFVGHKTRPAKRCHKTDINTMLYAFFSAYISCRICQLHSSQIYRKEERFACVLGKYFFFAQTKRFFNFLLCFYKSLSRLELCDHREAKAVKNSSCSSCVKNISVHIVHFYLDPGTG